MNKLLETMSTEEILELAKHSKSVNDFLIQAGIQSKGSGTVSGSFIREVKQDLISLGFDIDLYDARKQYEKNPKFCLYCKEKMPFEKRRNDFCGSTCSATYNNTGRKVSEETRKKHSRSMLGKNTGHRPLKEGEVLVGRKFLKLAVCQICKEQYP